MSQKRSYGFELESCEQSTELKKPKKCNALSMHDAQGMVQLAETIQNAQECVKGNAYGKLSIIAEQIDFLQKQAMRVLEKAKRDEKLHKVSCNLQKIPGRIYYLYRNINDNRLFFSIIASNEWGVSVQHKYLGAYRLEADRSWTSEENFLEVERRRVQCDHIFDNSELLRITQQ